MNARKRILSMLLAAAMAVGIFAAAPMTAYAATPVINTPAGPLAAGLDDMELGTWAGDGTNLGGGQPHLGVGDDGKFVFGELCNFLGRCYKIIVEAAMPGTTTGGKQIYANN